MATKPGMVPETQSWIVANIQFENVYFGTQGGCIAWIEKQRAENNSDSFFLYAPHSLHEIEVRNKVVWERSNG